MLELLYWDNPLLSTVCEPVAASEFGSKLEEFANQLLTTMNLNRGVGLAAPQVGINRRIFIMHFPESASRSGTLTAPPLAVCNPTLQFSGPMVYEQEGCLSLPSLYEQVGRQQFATIRYFTVLGEEKEIELKDMNTRVAAHEEEHLNGIMFFDRSHLSKQVNKALLRKWDKIKHRYVS